MNSNNYIFLNLKVKNKEKIRFFNIYLLLGFFFFFSLINIYESKAQEIKSNSLKLLFDIYDLETKKSLEKVNIIIKSNFEYERIVNINDHSEKIYLIKNINLDKLEKLNKIIIEIDINQNGYKEKHIVLSFEYQEFLQIIQKDYYKVNTYINPISYKSTSVIITTDNLDNNTHIAHKHTLENRQLHKEASQTLANTLKNEVGFSIASMGPATARPVIRGLNGNRILINEDGVPSVDISASSPDHAVTTDANSSERIEIIRGPKVLLFSPVSISGVIDVIKNKVPYTFPHNTRASFYSIFESMNIGNVIGGDLEIPFDAKDNKLVNDFNYLFKTNLNYKSTDDIRSPNRKLNNSSSESYNINTSLIKSTEDYDAGISVLLYKNDYQIPGGFVGAHPKGVNINIEKNNINFANSLHLHKDVIDDIKFNISRNYYFHTEFESNGQIGAQFKIENYFANIDFVQHKTDLFTDGIFGISANYKSFDIGGFVFTPPTIQSTLAAYVYEEIDLDDIEIQFSSRIFFDNYKPQQIINNQNAQNLFHWNYSNSLSIQKSINDNLITGFTISRTSKNPTIEELYSNGPHLAAYSYEIGNINLQPEVGYGLEFLNTFFEEDINFSVNIYYNYFETYITPRNTGRINFAQLLPIFQTSGVRSQIYGLESKFSQEIFEALTINTNLSITIGDNLDEKIPLPMIPPIKSKIDLTYKINQDNISVYSNLVAAQNRFDTFETKTNGYVLFGLEYSTIWTFSEKVLSVSFVLDNITNQIYYNHLSRIKSIMPEPGINFRSNFKLYI
jgi:iron complex outermembrane recepter protein